ncbi:MAG: RsmB/NOP family class I SAM-dependent RNA methyltransferase, partial [Candidatus Hydrogenedentes bacterium]|nr:RsmB/NOP family class I SAM-dependent RNA methyltransferase [Candidatus Hydrogenedentota bacterium]
ELCAAPGGKTTHLAALVKETTPVVGMDNQFRRVRSIVENYERLGLDNVFPIAGEGTHPPFLPQTFDRVLVDAPCTGLGTLRRHPDMKWHIGPEAPERLAAEQCALLRSGLAVCKNGGVVVYSVCTFTQEETEEVIRQVLGDGNATLEDGPEWLNRWKISRGQYRILPKPDQLDGYFLTRLRKGS